MDFLNIVSTPGPVLSRSRLGLVRLVTRFGQVDQAEDQVCQGQGQELDNNPHYGQLVYKHFISMRVRDHLDLFC